MFFGAVMMFKGYVSYHLMPLYACPELAKTVSSSLKKRMQGKSCFNFRAPDAALFAELSELNQRRARRISGQELAMSKG